MLLLPLLPSPLPELAGWLDGRVPLPVVGRVDEPDEGCVPAEGRVEAPVEGFVPDEGRVDAPVDGSVEGRVEAPFEGCVEGLL